MGECRRGRLRRLPHGAEVSEIVLNASDMRKTVSAAQAIVDSLIQHGVDTIFGIPGVHTYRLFDALYERRGEIRFVGTRHEQGAAYMAYGYAKSTGRVGADTCVPGPGFLNTPAVFCTAYAAIAPVLCLTSEIPAADIGRGFGILHELPDQLATLRSLTKWAARIDHPTQAPQILAEAFQRMTSGRPGPVALECPWDTLGVTALTEMSARTGALDAPPVDPGAVESAAGLIRISKKPMGMVGYGSVDCDWDADGAAVFAMAKDTAQSQDSSHRHRPPGINSPPVRCRAGGRREIGGACVERIPDIVQCQAALESRGADVTEAARPIRVRVRAAAGGLFGRYPRSPAARWILR